MAGGGVWGPTPNTGGEVGVWGLFPGDQRRPDQGHGEIRELHGGGGGEVQKNPGLPAECQTGGDRLVWTSFFYFLNVPLSISTHIFMDS